MRYWLIGLVAACLASPAGAREFKFTYGNSEIDFVAWTPAAPEYDYAGLAPSAERIRELEATGALVAELLVGEELHLRADGTIETRSTRVRYFLSKAATQEYGNMSEWVDAAFDKLSIEQAYTLTPDGRRLDVEPNAIDIRPDSSDDIFDDNFEVVLPYPGVEPHAITVVVTRSVEDSRALPIPWSRILRPEWFVPIEMVDMRFTWDSEAEAPAWSASIDGCKAAALAIECHFEKLPAVPSGENVVYSDVIATVAIAPKASWQTLAGSVSAYLEPKINALDPEIEQFVSALKAKTNNQDDILAELQRFVSQDIRYVGLEKGTGGIVPRDPALTFRQRFGDCKDKTTLFLAMARRAGFSAYPLLVATRRTKPGNLPLPALGYFDHMIACVHRDGAPDLCTDLTDPYSPVDSLSAGTQGTVALAIEATTEDVASLPADTYLDRVRVFEENAFNVTGGVEINGSYIYGGQYAAWLRGKIQPLDLGERKKWLSEWFRDNVGYKAEPELSVLDLHEVGKSLTIQYAMSFRSMIDPDQVRDDGLEYSDREPALRSIRRTYEAANRHFPTSFIGLEYASEFRYVFPADYDIVFTGAKLDLESPYGDLRRDYDRDGTAMSVRTRANFPAATIPLADKPRFNRWLGYVEDHSKFWFKLTRLKP
jgi:transglutaminase-like putative cysteine protease